MQSLFVGSSCARAIATLAVLIWISTSPIASYGYITLHEGPAYNPLANTGYSAPSFRFIAFPTGNAETGRLLNNAGTATWNAIDVAVNDSRALRWNPTAGPATVLGLPGGVFDPETVPHAIAADDTVVGYVTTNTGNRAAKWNGTGTALTFLADGPFLDPFVANDINDSDVIVGQADFFDQDDYFGTAAVRWVSGNIEMLSRPSALVDSETGGGSIKAVSVNESGEAIGSGVAWSGGSNIGQRAVRWDSSGAGTVLGPLGTGPTGVSQVDAWAINDDGAAIGSAHKYDEQNNYDGFRAVRWNAESTTAIELEVLGTDPTGYSDSHVYDINNAGQSVGYSLEHIGGVNFGRRAVIWDDAGEATELLSLYENGHAEAFDINESGIAVGTALNNLFQGRAVYWTENGVPVDLNTLIEPHSDWVLARAWAISDSGWILGEGSHIVDPDGPGGQPGTQYSRVFMLQLPETPALLGDYNDDNVVDAADYVVWRKHLGTNTTLPNDPSFGVVNAFDYTTWKANFGEAIIEVGSGTAIPEPAALGLAVLGMAVLAQFRARNRRKNVA